ncbi:MAG: beta-galactosidase [Deltaproteobacteria bacterium]|nr:beta-galactosidase [Deltaproteobacteria bacterium]
MDPLCAAVVRLPTLSLGRWAPCLQALRALGFNAVDLPLVWRDHAEEDGTFNLGRGTLDLAAMLHAVRAAGLKLVVRAGPFGLPQSPGGGVPEAVLRDPRCQLRTRRGNPCLTLHGGALVPLPDPASEAYRRAARSWVQALARRLAEPAREGLLTRFIVGHGPDPGLHHEPSEASLGQHLLESAREEGLPESALAATGSLLEPLQGGVTVAAAPPPHAGSTALWRALRAALARAPSLHLDLRSGGPVFERPTLPAHTEEVARLALAAGVRSYSVFLGCAGSGWVGALLDEEGSPRPPAARWRALNALAASLPTGRELCVALPPRPDRDLQAPFGALLGWAGLRAPEPGGDPGREAEGALSRRALPWRRAPDPEAPTVEALEALAPEVRPEGAALTRVVEASGELFLVALNRSEGAASVGPGPRARWRAGGASAEGFVTLGPGAVGVFSLASAEVSE